MKPYSNITCGVLSPLDLSSPEFATAILQLLARYAFISPTHAGNWEPLKDKYTEISGGISHWKNPFLWKNTRSGTTGSIWFGRGLSHSCIYVHASPHQSSASDPDWVSFLIDACGLLEADIGYVHLTTQDEFADADIPYECTYAVNTGLTTTDLLRGIPKLCWGTYLSGPYKEIGLRFKKLSLPIIVAEPRENAFYVQLTPAMDSVSKDYQVFKNVRRTVQDQVGGSSIFGCKDQAWRPHFMFKHSGASSVSD
jgi:hypothetical protein